MGIELISLLTSDDGPGAMPSSQSRPPRDGIIDVTIDRSRLIGELVGIALLTILTLGVYRFWGRTRVRQRFWGSVSVLGEPLVYTGTGKELFVGFLLALVVLVPFITAATLIIGLIPPTSVGLRFMAQMGLAVAFAPLGIMGMYFSRRYLLTRTRWRGVYAGQGGNLREYMLVHLKAYGLSLLTLGLIQPRIDARTYNYRTSMIWFGTESFAAEATPAGLWRLWLPTWALFIALYIVGFVAFWPLIEWSQTVAPAQAAGQAIPPAPDVDISSIIAFVFLWLGVVVGVFAYYIRRAVLFFGATRLGSTEFSMHLTWYKTLYIPLGAFGLTIVVIFLTMFILGIVIALIGLVVGAVQVVAVVAPFIVTVVMFMVFNVVSVAWTQVEMLRLIGRHLRIHNIDAIEDILNRGAPAPRRGEGLAEALGDVGIGV